MAHSVSRSQLFAGFLAAVLMAMGTPALAAKKKKAAEASEGGEAGLLEGVYRHQRVIH